VGGALENDRATRSGGAGSGARRRGKFERNAAHGRRLDDSATSGLNDLGASIALKGEVSHPGTYGIRPGERLSSVLERAGGFQPNAYRTAAVLQRVQVREMELRSQDEVVRVSGMRKQS